MKRLTTYISHMKELHSFNEYLNEKLIINKNYNDPYTYTPKSFKELRKIIEDKYNKLGPGTEQKPVYFNDVNISNIDSFYDRTIGIFEITKFEYIDISNWDVSNVKDMSFMFHKCKKLKFVGDLSNWNISKVKDMYEMFNKCYNLKSVGDLSNWNVSNVEDMSFMFYGCEQLKSVGDLSKWNVSECKNMYNMFENSGITNIPNWYKE